MDAIYVLEFGGQYTDRIVARLEDMGFNVRYAASDTSLSSMRDAKGIILSGGPKSVHDSGYPYDPNIFRTGVPVLGICYGMQLLAHELGGEIYRNREYGETRLLLKQNGPLFEGFADENIVWMNHGDSVRNVEDSFYITGITEKGAVAAIRSRNGPYYGVQFHPEVTHTENGSLLLHNFAEKICHCTRGEPRALADPQRFIEEARYEISQQIRNGAAVVFASGGVDSTVAFMLANPVVKNLVAVHIDTGFNRKDESRGVKAYLEELTGREVHVLDTGSMFTNCVSRYSDPEEKRNAFRDAYAHAEELSGMTFDFEDAFLIQGTLETDSRESGKESVIAGHTDSGTVAKIKSHHNVGGLQDRKRAQGRLVEPLRMLTKEEARNIGRALGLLPEITERQPFPGPGLSVRVITGVYACDDELGGNARETAKRYGLDGYALPVKTVGIKGDERSFEHLALLAGDPDWHSIRAAAKEITEELPVNRVVYAYGRRDFDAELLGKTRPLGFSRKTLDLAREVDYIVAGTLKEFGVRPAQVPCPVFPGYDGAWAAVRDVDSVDFRTVRPLRKPEEFPWECCEAITERILENEDVRKYGGIYNVCFDASDKPPATTEWE